MKKAIFTLLFWGIFLAVLPLSAAPENVTPDPLQVLSEGELKPVAQMVMDARRSRSRFSLHEPFALVKTNETFDGSLLKSTILRIDATSQEALFIEQPAFMELKMTDAQGQPLALDLVRVDPYAPGFKVTTSDSDEPVSLDLGVHYRGVIQGKYNTLAAFTLFKDGMIGMISTDNANIVLHPVEKTAGEFVVYEDVDILNDLPFTCATDLLDDISDKVVRKAKSRATGDCVRVYLECDYALFVNKGSVQNTVNWITAVFNNMATLYTNEQINTAISEIFVWTSQDSYSKTNSVTALTQFRTARPSFNGDLAHLAALGGQNLGGVAWLNSLCTTYKYAYSNISSTYQNVPTYSWTVMVMTHEMGHNLGSNHTQWCGWPVGALDNCYQTEGGCPQGPAPTNGGTIMSYCHLTNNGINFNNGFGTYPGNAIRTGVQNANCLNNDCQGGGGGGGCDTPTGLAASNVTHNSALVSWNSVAGATSYNFQYKLTVSNTWSQVNVTGTAVSFTNLSPNTSYDCRVQAVCSEGTSEFTTTLTFVTLEAPAYCASAGQSTSREWIRLVQLGSINRSSGSDGGYFDGTSLSTFLRRGARRTITYRAGFSNGSRRIYWRVWIDYNQDGDFNDSGELVVSRNSSSSSNLSSNFTIPNSALLGPTRMRVQAKFNAYSGNCEIFPFGEVEDYTVNISTTQGLEAGDIEATEIVIKDVSVYPNPAYTDLNIQFYSDNETELQVDIMDYLGKTVRTQTYYMEEGENLLGVPLDNLQAGPYMLLLKTGENVQVHKFVKSE
jgi:hypothetical protein